eukprot:Em0226g1a
MMHAGIELRMQPLLFMLSSSETQVLCTCGPSSPSIPIPLPCPSNGMLPSNPTIVITAYTLHHRVPSLKSQSEMWAPPSTATVQFHTYNPAAFSSTRINSGYVVLFEQASNTFYVTVDTVHTAAITAAIVPLLTMKVYLRDFPARRAIWHCNPLQGVV